MEHRAVIYKIFNQVAWDMAVRAGVFLGSADDTRDGFIHFSTGPQLEGTLAKYYAGQSDLVLAAIEADRLGADLKWEPARGGALFPHLYAPLELTDVVWVRPLPLGDDGRHVIPQGVL